MGKVWKKRWLLAKEAAKKAAEEAALVEEVVEKTIVVAETKEVKAATETKVTEPPKGDSEKKEKSLPPPHVKSVKEEAPKVAPKNTVKTGYLAKKSKTNK
tara:strand:+ start:440 stop:739 length:300 start_codon:yes stop_codon:yes gene_type:complete